MESSKIAIKGLINLFEKKIDKSQEEKLKELAIQRISEQQKKYLVNLLRRKESPKHNYYVVQQSSLVSLTPSESLALQQRRSQASIDSGRSTVTLPGESPTRIYLEEPNRGKELEKTSKTSQYDSENSRTSILTKSSATIVDRLNYKQEIQRQDSVKHKQLEQTARLVQSHQTTRTFLTPIHEESSKERQMRIEMEKQVKHEKRKISGLSKQLEEMKRELLRYKTDQIKRQEVLKKQIQLNFDLSRQLSQANDKIATLIQQLEAIASNTSPENKNSASKLMHLKQKNESKPKIDQEKEENKIKLFDNQIIARKNQPKLEDVMEEVEVKTTLSEIKTTPKEIKTTPKEIKTTPKEIKTTPKEIKTTPEEIKTKPKEIKTTPEENKTTPEEIKTKPKEIKTTSEKIRTTPAEIKTTPEEIKKTPEETKLEVKMKKSSSHSGKDLPAPVFSHSFSMSELTKSCQLLPNLRCGLDRPRPKKNHATSCSGTIGAHIVDPIKRSQLKIISTK